MNLKEKSQLIAEFRILKSLVHPNIVRCYHHEHIPQDSSVYLYMEYCGGGDLAGIIRNCKATGTYVPESMVWSVFTQLVLALYRCHYNADPPPPGDLFTANVNGTSITVDTPPPQPTTVILHRDLKPDNVFLDQDNAVKLGDFGLAKILDQEHFLANTYVGTPYYMSPEVMMDKPFTPQSDIWSLGCVMYELCARHPPFQAKTHLQLSQKIQDGVFPPLPPVYSAVLSKTIAACINVNQAQRPTTATLLRLDVMKLCRRERELMDAQRQVEALREQIFKEREVMLKQMQLEQMQMYQQVQDEMDAEVARRVKQIMEQQHNQTKLDSPITSKQQQQQQQNYQSGPSSPQFSIMSTDVPMPSYNIPPSRNVKGPRVNTSPSPRYNPTMENLTSTMNNMNFPFQDNNNSNSHYNSNASRTHQNSNNNSSSSMYQNNNYSSSSSSTMTNASNHHNNHHHANSPNISSSGSSGLSHSSSSFSSSVSSYETELNRFGFSGTSANNINNINNIINNNIEISSGSLMAGTSSTTTLPRERQPSHYQGMYEAKKSIISTPMGKVMAVKGHHGSSNSVGSRRLWEEDLSGQFTKRRV
jgi:NIMA (never in mitosis gene a)-related kinase